MKFNEQLPKLSEHRSIVSPHMPVMIDDLFISRRELRFHLHDKDNFCMKSIRVSKQITPEFQAFIRLSVVVITINNFWNS